ncbi:hypothetical protein B5P43_15620 [Bacillus sp. SRB_336]|nr:hypothetical protein B5P43_15620 [Bacillus sp. SRB_336]
MAIEEPTPKTEQTKAFTAAAAAMRAVRYDQPSESLDEQIAFLKALGDVATETAWQFQRYDILDPAGLEAYRKVSYSQLPTFISTSAEVVITFPIARAIEGLEKLGACNLPKAKEPRYAFEGVAGFFLVGLGGLGPDAEVIAVRGAAGERPGVGRHRGFIRVDAPRRQGSASNR